MELCAVTFVFPICWQKSTPSLELKWHVAFLLKSVRSPVCKTWAARRMCWLTSSLIFGHIPSFKVWSDCHIMMEKLQESVVYYDPSGLIGLSCAFPSFCSDHFRSFLCTSIFEWEILTGLSIRCHVFNFGLLLYGLDQLGLSYVG